MMRRPQKLMLFLATEKGYTSLMHVMLKHETQKIGCVISFEETNVQKSWHEDIFKECHQHHIPCFLWNQAKNNLEEMIQRYMITSAVAISWKYLLPLTINSFLDYSLIVFHDSLLPRYRGFAPTPTAIICGEKKIGVTALYATDQVDQGEVILQREMPVPEDKYMADIIREQSDLYAEMLADLISKMEEGTLTSTPQNEERATYSIWRSPDDCHIDWNRSSKEIYNFVRAISPPYPGAFTFMNQKKIRILRTEILEQDLIFQIRDAGKIWRIENHQPEVICGTGILKILLAVDEDDRPVNFNHVRCRLE